MIHFRGMNSGEGYTYTKIGESVQYSSISIDNVIDLYLKNLILAVATKMQHAHKEGGLSALLWSLVMELLKLLSRNGVVALGY